jgi:hypothetical protein
MGAKLNDAMFPGGRRRRQISRRYDAVAFAKTCTTCWIGFRAQRPDARDCPACEDLIDMLSGLRRRSRDGYAALVESMHRGLAR